MSIEYESNETREMLARLNEALSTIKYPHENFTLTVETYDNDLLNAIRGIHVEGVTNQEGLGKAISSDPSIIVVMAATLPSFLIALGKFFGYLQARESRIAKETKAQEKTNRTIAKIRAKQEVAQIQALVPKGIESLDLTVEKNNDETEEQDETEEP